MCSEIISAEISKTRCSPDAFAIFLALPGGMACPAKASQAKSSHAAIMM
jgi:hypothetical protein